MSFLVWNCRGMGQSRAVDFLRDIVSQQRPSVIFLSETLVRKNKIQAICKLLHFADYFAVDAQGHGGGLALMWKNAGGVVIKGSCNHYIDFEVMCEQIGRWRYTGFYGCPERRRREESWDLIRELKGKSDLPWCILGDFNDMMFGFEKVGGRPQPRRLLDGFTKAIMECNLIDLGFTGHEFTWEKSRGTDGWIQERLDRGFATQVWRNLFPQAEVKVLDVSTSDHLPLVLQLNAKVYVPKARRFKFENMWIKEPECINLVNSSWNANDTGSILEKIEYVSLKLEEWGGGKTKELRVQIQNCRKMLGKFRSRRDTYGVQQYNDIRAEYLKLLEK